LAEEHGDKLRPAGKSLGGVFGAVLLHEWGEPGARKMLEQLMEEAGSLYDWVGPPCGRGLAKSRLGTFRRRSIIGGLFTRARQKLSETVLDKSGTLPRSVQLQRGIAKTTPLITYRPNTEESDSAIVPPEAETNIRR
jgi:hypothetical protein